MHHKLKKFFGAVQVASDFYTTAEYFGNLSEGFPTKYNNNMAPVPAKRKNSKEPENQVVGDDIHSGVHRDVIRFSTGLRKSKSAKTSSK